MQINLANYTKPHHNTKKKLKINDKIDLNEFKDGSIIKLKLHNFVTYKFTEFTLSPSLNMIIGPNGSGKSTFVCAVCLGLAGKTEFIGRMKKVEDFIKNGEDVARIDTYLRDSTNTKNGMTIISRFIYTQGKKSIYKIDNKDVTEQTVRNLIINKFNIQLDNLCQFLSQERVEEFARLKSDKLLVETMRSIDSSLLTVFNNLKSLQDIEIKTQREVDLKKNNLESLRSKRDILNEKVSILKDYETKMKEIEYHNKLLPYVFIKDHKLKLETYKNDYKIAKNQVKTLLNDKKPFIHNQESILNQLEQSKREQIEITNYINKLESNITETQSTLNVIRDDINKKKTQIEYYENRTQRVRNNIKLEQSELVSKQKDLEKYVEILPPMDAITNIDNEKSQLIDKQQSIQLKNSQLTNKARQENHNIEQLQNQIRNIRGQLTLDDKIGILDKKKLQSLKESVLYIRSKREEINGSILEPPIMTVSMDDAILASYLAQCVDWNTATSLTLINSSTYETYNKELLQYKVNLRELSPNFDMNQHRLPIEQVKSLGFDGYLSDFVKGNPKVITMLCQISKIHLIPVSRRELSIDQLNRLTHPSDGRVIFQRFIHSNKIVNVRKSSYASKQVFSSDSQIKRTDLYQTNVMTEEDKAAIHKQIEQKRLQIDERKRNIEQISASKGDLSAETSEIEKKLDELRIRLHKWNTIRNKHSSLIQDIETLKENIAKLKHEATKDVSGNIQNVQKSIMKQLKQQTDLTQKLTKYTGKIKNYQDKLIEARIKMFESQNLQITLTDVMSSLLERERELKNEYESKKETVKNMRDTEEYKSWMQQIRSYDEDLKVELNEYAEKYENDNNFNANFIQEMVDKLESEISMMNHDASSITILQNVEKEIEELETVLPGLVKLLKETKEGIKKDHESFVPKLNSFIEQISAKFGKLFTNVGSAGEVRLEKPTLYEEWNIEILVKFRDNTPLKRLDSHTQSGGERAVSTVLYMISLQEFTSAPFRVVDEINQGMDQRNERIVHRAMVENACAENTSQYFLITPKLLTDLHYHPKMRIHCVMAGPWIPNPSEDSEMVHFGETRNYVL
ncbi:structural maintenance of chromosomes protein 5 [Monosporozyma servazzii]